MKPHAKTALSLTRPFYTMTKSRNTKAVVEPDPAFYAQVRDVFVQARQFVHKTANFAMVKAYWLVGKMIVEKQGGEAKAAYGDRLIDELSVRLTQDLGAGFTRVNLFYMRRFYLAFQNVHTLCEQLSWSHYRLLISVENEEARAYYLEEARKSLWSVRERTQSKTQILSRNWTLARSAA